MSAAFLGLQNAVCSLMFSDKPLRPLQTGCTGVETCALIPIWISIGRFATCAPEFSRFKQSTRHSHSSELSVSIDSMALTKEDSISFRVTRHLCNVTCRSWVQNRGRQPPVPYVKTNKSLKRPAGFEDSLQPSMEQALEYQRWKPSNYYLLT
ncbi:hypothetical protein GOODEAATRI_000114 [Goodea atripinnis]|uniref:Uncharacterized protein n=1 Tax=Goodea atripinnis TaxID=208336 RepID=A0ABV0PJP8_9TELE